MPGELGNPVAVGARLIRRATRNAHLWRPQYLADRWRRRREPPPRTVWLTIVDHYEPLWKGAAPVVAAARVERWRSEWPKISARDYDSAWRPPQYGFFYPAEEYRPELLEPLAEMARMGIGGACTGTGPCSVAMSAARTATANFNLAPTSYSLTVTKAGTGAGTVASSPAGISCGADCSESYLSSAVVALSATAGQGSTFTGWSGACTGTGPCSVTMTAAKAVNANFAVAGVVLTVGLVGSGSGIVTSSPAGISCGGACVSGFPPNTIVKLSAAPAAGSGFRGWSGACAGISPCSVTMTQAKTVTATFENAYPF